MSKKEIRRNREGLSITAQKLDLELGLIKDTWANEPNAPWWIGECEDLCLVLHDFLTGNSRVSQPIIDSTEGGVNYYETYESVLRGMQNAKLPFKNWVERLFSHQKVNKLPTEESEAIPQLGITMQWIGDEYGASQEIHNQMWRISKVHLEDFPRQLKDSFQLAGSKDRQLQASYEAGQFYQRYTVDSATIELQQVYYNNVLDRPVFKPIMSLRVNRQLTRNRLLRTFTKVLG
jgi:hypothetical protein